jgi:hypothetical protein
MLNCEQMRESGCKVVTNLFRCRGKAKTVTNNLPLLTVLATGVVCPVLLQGTKRFFEVVM